jgi:hypothetical protein
MPARPFARCTAIRGVLMPVLLVALAACSSTVERVSDPDSLAGLAFLQPGVTTRTEIEARLGPPWQLYEPDRVATYHLEQRKDRFEATENSFISYNLVLLFRPDGVLDKWSLVKK